MKSFFESDMNILDQLKNLDQSQITNAGIKDKINTALGFYDDKDDLTAQEVQVYEKLLAAAQKNIQENKNTQLKNQQRMQEQEIENQKKAELAKRSEAIRNIEFPHQKFLKEHNLQIKDTNNEVKASFKGFTAIYGKWIKNPDNKSAEQSSYKASETLKGKLEKFMSKKNEDTDAAKAAAEKEKQEADAAQAAKKKADDDAATQAAAKKKADDDAAAAEKAKQEKAERNNSRPLLNRMLGLGHED